MSTIKINILLIEDNPGDARLIIEMLKDSVNIICRVLIADCLDSAITKLDEEKVDLIILDLNLPDSNGISTLIRVLNKTVSLVPVIVLTGINDEDLGISAIERGAEDYLVKGEVELKKLSRSIRYAIERKKMAGLIQQSEQKYRELIEIANSAIIRWKSNGEIAYINEYALKLFGYNPEEIIGRHVNIIVPETESTGGDLSNLAKNIVDNPEKHASVLNENICKDGHRIWMLWTNKPVVVDSKVEEILAIGSDVTELKNTKDALAESEEIYRTFTNSVDQRIFLKDEFFRNIMTNDFNAEFIGKPVKEIIGKTDFELLPQDAAAKCRESDEIALEKNKLVITEENFGGRIYESRKFPVKLKNGKSGIGGYIQDITDRKIASDLLNARLKLINFSDNHSMAELMVEALNEAERFTSSSISFFHFVDDDQKSLSLQVWSTKTSQEYCKAEGKGIHYNVSDAGVWADSVRERKPVVHNDYNSLPYRRGLPEGHAAVIRELVVPIIRNDIIKGILGIGNKTTDYLEIDISLTSYFADLIWDIVERKRSAEYLKNINKELEIRVAERTAELEKANKELESFSYSVSHDLRSPLRHISGFAEMLKSEMSDINNEKINHYLDVIFESSKRMGQLIDDLLSFSRMKRSSLSSQNVNMEALVDEVLNEFAGDINKNGITVSRLELPGARGDAAMIRVVIINLISNAVKFTSKLENPFIIIGSKVIDDKIVYFVRDNGSGFDMQYSDKLFGVFQRLHSDRDFEGTGIGLAMVKSIIERHNGRIWAESEPGKGASFYFILPDNKNEKTRNGDEKI